MRKTTIGLFLILAAVAFSGRSDGATTANVDVRSDLFTDQTSGSPTTTINVGDTVKWTWKASDHSVTSGTCTTDPYGGDVSCSSNGLFDSGIQNNGFTFDGPFPIAGSFPYFCQVHGRMGMRGTIVVKAIGGSCGTITLSPATLSAGIKDAADSHDHGERRDRPLHVRARDRKPAAGSQPGLERRPQWRADGARHVQLQRDGDRRPPVHWHAGIFDRGRRRLAGRRRGRHSRRRISPRPGRSPLPHPAPAHQRDQSDDRRQDRVPHRRSLRDIRRSLAALYAQLLADDQLRRHPSGDGLPGSAARTSCRRPDPRRPPTPASTTTGARPERPDSRNRPSGPKTPPRWATPPS